MSDSDPTPSESLAQAPIVVQSHTITLRDSGASIARNITMGECLAEKNPLPALLFAQVLLLSDMTTALKSMAATIEASASSAGAHKASAEATLDDTLARVVGFMSKIPGMDPTVVTQMTNALKPPNGGGTPA